MIQAISRFALACTLLVLCAALVMPDAQAQDTPEPKRFENVDWNNVVLVDYKPGKRGRALEIISDHFIPAAEQAGLDMPVMVEMMSGEYDMMLIWTMKEGPASMTWERSPDGVKWWQSFVELAGSEEEAEKIDEEYNSLVVRSTNFIGFSGRHGMRLASN